MKPTSWVLSAADPGEYPPHKLQVAPAAGAAPDAAPPEQPPRAAASPVCAVEVTGLGEGWGEAGAAPVPCTVAVKGEGCFLVVSLLPLGGAPNGDSGPFRDRQPQKVYLDAEVRAELGRQSCIVTAPTAPGMLRPVDMTCACCPATRAGDRRPRCEARRRRARPYRGGDCEWAVARLPALSMGRCAALALRRSCAGPPADRAASGGRVRGRRGSVPSSRATAARPSPAGASSRRIGRRMPAGMHSNGR